MCVPLHIRNIKSMMHIRAEYIDVDGHYMLSRKMWLGAFYHLDLAHCTRDSHDVLTLHQESEILSGALEIGLAVAEVCDETE